MRVVITADGYETTCSRRSIEERMRTEYHPEAFAFTHDQANLPRRASLPWIEAENWRISSVAIGDADDMVWLHCAHGVEQCDYCRLGQARRERQSVMDAVPAGFCVYCGTLDAPTVDHVIPQCQGGPHIPSNLVRSCRECNSSKGGLTPRQWIASGPPNLPAQWTLFARLDTAEAADRIAALLRDAAEPWAAQSRRARARKQAGQAKARTRRPDDSPNEAA